MDELLKELKEWGCDIDGAMDRLDHDTELYSDCLQMFKDDPSFDALAKAVKDGDIQAGFDQAHTIKGVAANLGLSPIWQNVFPLVEIFRAGKSEGSQEAYAKLAQSLQEYRDILAKN